MPACVIGTRLYSPPPGMEDQVSLGVGRQLLRYMEALVVNPAWEIWPSQPLVTFPCPRNGWVPSSEQYA
jgi:hypothetical protein